MIIELFGLFLRLFFFFLVCAWLWGKTEKQSFLSCAEYPLKQEAPLLVATRLLPSGPKDAVLPSWALEGLPVPSSMKFFLIFSKNRLQDC